MKSTFKLIFIAIFATVSFGALAADWTVTQTARITTAAPDLKQGNDATVSNSEQAINGIALKTGEDNLTNGSSQLATLTSTTSLNLTQGPNVDGSSQAINYLEAEDVGVFSAAPAVTQTVTSESTATTLTQTVSGGDGNVQALNIGKASGTGSIFKLNQVVTEAGTLSLVQNDVTTAGNVQAVNYAFGQTIGAGASSKLEQATSVAEATTFSQAATGGDNRQGGNIAVTSGSGTGVATASQTFTASAVIGLTQSMATGDGNVQALNQVDTTANTTSGTVGTVDQTFTNTAGTGTTFTSTAGSGSNVQAANLVDTLGSITDLEQTFTASGSSQVNFQMTGSGDTNIQAGNMARTDGTGSVIVEITQTFTGSAAANIFNQNSSGDNLVQSGNLIALGQGALTDASGPHQVFATGIGSIAMTQQGGGIDNLQALNAITDKPGGTAATQAHQTITTAGAFTMSQNAMTTSGQYGNFAGEEL